MKRRQVIKTILAGCAAPIVTQVLPNFRQACAESEEEPCPIWTEEQFQIDDNRYCNALILSTAWEKSIDEAKSYIDENLDENALEIVKALASARKKISHKAGWLCKESHFYRSDQMESLAKYWKLDIDASKAKVNKMLFHNESFRLVKVLGKATAQFPQGSPYPSSSSDPMSIKDYEVFQKLYSYCDAEVLAYHWSTSTTDAKAKILSLGSKKAQDALIMARKNKQLRERSMNLCDYRQQFSYKDIEKLSVLWKTDIDHAKMKTSQKMIDGESAELRRLLQDKPASKSMRVRRGKVIRKKTTNSLKRTLRPAKLKPRKLKRAIKK